MIDENENIGNIAARINRIELLPGITNVPVYPIERWIRPHTTDDVERLRMLQQQEADFSFREAGRAKTQQS